MRSFRYFFRLTLAFIQKFKAIILIGIFLGILVFFMVSFLGSIVFGKSTQRIGVSGRYRTDSLPAFILGMISDGLTTLTESGIPEPGLASSWETPDKGKTWIFHLREDRFWQDSKPVGSSTIVYEFTDVTVERPDERTIVFKLESPFAPFPVVVSRPTFRKGLLGTKGWKVKKISLAGQYVSELTLVNSEEGKRIFKFYPTLERTKLAFKLGEVDKLINIFEPSPFQNWGNVNLESNVNSDQVITLFFNTQDKTLSEKPLRQALIYAIDRSTFTEEAAISPISPNSWAFNPQTKEYNYDSKRASELIDELSKEQIENLEIKLVTVPILLSVAEKIAKNWEVVGIKTSVQVSSIIPSEFQVFLAIFDIPKDPDQYSIWHSTQVSTNISKYTNPRIDKLLEDGRIALDSNERRKIYLDFQRFLSEDLPAAFLFHPTYYTLSRK